MSVCTDSCNLPNLPEEIWSEIFTYLPRIDRKCVRLTCHRFYNACNVPSLQEDEEIAFRKIWLLPFLSVERKVWNIRLRSLAFEDYDLVSEFFEKWGPRVRSLALENFTLVPGLLRFMIEHCQSLRRISLEYSFGAAFDVRQTIFDDFVTLQNSQVVRSTVQDFTFKLSEKGCRSHYPITNLKFVRFFSVFPHVKNFDFLFAGRGDDSIDLTSDTNLSLRGMCNQFRKMSDQLEKLTVRFYGNRRLNHLISIQGLQEFAQIEMKNLKELFFSWPVCSFIQDISSMKPFWQFSHLTHLDCYISRVPVSEYILLLLASATELRHLFIDAFHSYEHSIDIHCFVALVQSKLTHLNLMLNDKHGCTPVISGENLQSDLENLALSPNYSLRNLLLDTKSLDSWALFITYFRNLDHLGLLGMNYDILQNICNCQTNLRSLGIRNVSRFVENCSWQKWLEKGSQLSNRKLQHLTRLFITEDSHPFFCLTEFLANELVFPKLQSLTIFQNSDLCSISISELYRSTCVYSSEDILQIICKFPQVQYVRLSLSYKSSFEQWLSLVQTLTNLRSLYISDKSLYFPILGVHKLFEIRSSLLTVRHNRIIFYKNYSSNTIVCKEV